MNSIKNRSDMDNELFGETHEQEENGLFGKQHQAEQCFLYNVSYCYECNKPYDGKDREHGMCHKCCQPIIE